MAELVAGCLLAHASYTDLRWRRIRNWAVASAAAVGVLLALATRGLPGLLVAGEGIAAGAGWWLAVTYLKLGAGDAKLAMAIGAILGPGAALTGPALGYGLCAVALLPWIAWRKVHGLAWREVALPMAPWIAVGTVLVLAVRGAGLTALR